MSQALVRIVYISGSVIPSRSANSMNVMKMCQAMAQAGHRLLLVTPSGDGLWKQGLDSVWHHYGIRYTFPIEFLPASRLARSYDFVLLSLIKALSVRPDLIYTRVLPSAVASALLGLPTVYECHEIPGGRTGPVYFRALLRARGLKRIAVISQALLQRLRQFFVARMAHTPFEVAPDAVDLERFLDLPGQETARNVLGLPPDRFIAGYAGHLYEGRGISLILKLAAMCKDITFLIMGGNPGDIAKRLAQARQLGVQNINFLGFLPNADLPLHLTACDVLLMPYQSRVAISGGGDSSAYMSPMKMFEYMASQRMIIASDLPVLREILDDTNAVLCPPDNVQAWRDAIIKASAFPGWRAELAAKARLDVEKYTWRARLAACLPTSPFHRKAANDLFDECA